MPYALLAKVEAEINRLVKEGVLESVQFSEWATPVVPSPKRDMEQCGCVVITRIRSLKLIPQIEDVGGRYCVLKAQHDSSLFTNSGGCTINMGLFQFIQSPFGVASALSIFQRIVENILQGLPGICSYIDDILISQKTPEEH